MRGHIHKQQKEKFSNFTLYLYQFVNDSHLIFIKEIQLFPQKKPEKVAKMAWNANFRLTLTSEIKKETGKATLFRLL